MIPTVVYEATSDEYPELLAIWEASVRATHHFLKEDDLQHFKKVIPTDYFPAVSLYYLKNEFNRIIAFLGISEKHLDTLFIDPEERGKGWGKMLTSFAVAQLGVNTVDVNEQNEQAVGFYHKIGFEETSRDAMDASGKPYPILHMKLKPDPQSFKSDIKVVEHHPLGFFLPPNAKILMLGSFPPKKIRWSMNFYYPNIQNDMWRILGLLFFNDKEHFLIPGKKAFDEIKARDFCMEKGIAIGDTAEKVIRWKDNASDKFLEVVKPLDIERILKQVPECSTIIITGQKAMDTFLSVLPVQEPVVGGFTPFRFRGREMRLYRMPSSSRAYPKPLEEKASMYQKAFIDIM